MFIFLPSFDLSLILGVPCIKIKVIDQCLVFLLRIPILHYLADIGLNVPGSLKEQFWTLLGSLKAPGSFKVVYRLRAHAVSCQEIENVSKGHFICQLGFQHRMMH